MVRHQGVSGVFTRQHAGKGEARRQIHGHVLERMHRQIGFSQFQGNFQLFDKQALAADFTQGSVQYLVAQRCHSQQIDGMPTLIQKFFDVLCLPKCQPAFAGGDDPG